MSATVAAALKKIAVSLLSNPKVLKTVLGIVLGIIVIIIMPIVAIVSIFNGDIEIDTGRLQTMVVENLSAEEQQKLQAVENTMYDIEDEMKAAVSPVRSRRRRYCMYLRFPTMPDSLILFPSWWAVLLQIRRMNSSFKQSTLHSAHSSQPKISAKLWEISALRQSTFRTLPIPQQKQFGHREMAIHAQENGWG